MGRYVGLRFVLSDAIRTKQRDSDSLQSARHLLRAAHRILTTSCHTRTTRRLLHRYREDCLRYFVAPPIQIPAKLPGSHAATEACKCRSRRMRQYFVNNSSTSNACLQRVIHHRSLSSPSSSPVLTSEPTHRRPRPRFDHIKSHQTDRRQHRDARRPLLARFLETDPTRRSPHGCANPNYHAKPFNLS